MFVHVDAEIFERRPMLGVGLGVLGLIVSGLLTFYVVRQLAAFGAEPEAMDVAQVAPPPLDFWETGRWVSLSGPMVLSCREIIQTRSDLMESIIFGKIRASYIPARDPARQRFFLLEYKGDMDCARAAKLPLQGLLVAVNSRLLATLKRGGLEFPVGMAVPYMLFTVGEGPEAYRKYAGFCALMCWVSLWCVARYLKKYRQTF